MSLPFEQYEPVLLRAEDTTWTLGVFKGLSSSYPDMYLFPFQSWEGKYSIAAPVFESLWKVVGTQEDVYTLTDLEVLKEQGLIPDNPDHHITQAAIKKDGVVYTGRSHSEIWNLCREKGCWEEFQEDSMLGFVDREGNFFDQFEASKVAYGSGQIKKYETYLFDRML